MSVFICWSGDRSLAIAKALRELLESTLTPLKEPGAVFFSEATRRA